MRTKKNLLALTAAVVCALTIWFSTSIQGKETTYEVRPQISVPEYRTDAARAIDAYEHIVQRLMDTNKNSLAEIDTTLKTIAKKLDSIDASLARLSARMAGIEKALSLKKLKPPEHKAAHQKPAQIKNPTTPPTPDKK